VNPLGNPRTQSKEKVMQTQWRQRGDLKGNETIYNHLLTIFFNRKYYKVTFFFI